MEKRADTYGRVRLASMAELSQLKYSILEPVLSSTDNEQPVRTARHRSVQPSPIIFIVPKT